MKKHFCIAAVCLSVVWSAPSAIAATSDNKLFQVATIYALEFGIFEGDYSYKDLMQKGTLGIGTFTAVDGEMVAIDGQYYQSRPNCHLRPVSAKWIAPFAEVIHFQPTLTVPLNNLGNYHALGQWILEKFPNQNMPYAIRIDGTFSAIKLRSLTKQAPPYPNLLIASKTQGVLELKNIRGSAVGFWFPHYWEGIGMPGFHLHFASADRKFGGHVLEISVAQAQAQLEPIQNVQVYLPKSPLFTAAHLPAPSTLEKDLLEVEGAH